MAQKVNVIYHSRYESSKRPEIIGVYVAESSDNKLKEDLEKFYLREYGNETDKELVQIIFGSSAMIKDDFIEHITNVLKENDEVENPNDYECYFFKTLTFVR